jgi:hypothetical protein
MTQVKTNDIIKLTSEDSELNGVFLVGSITPSEIVLRTPPNQEYTLNIQDGVIENVETVEIVYSSKISGFSDKMGFTQDKTVCITFSDGQETCGIVQEIENDMIDVELEDKTHVYIDFEYEGLPEGVHSIVLDNPLQFEEMEEHFLFPEKNRRYPIANQLTDLMDSLMTKQQHTSSHIKNANLIVKRFKELKTLFTNEDQDPRILPSGYKPTVLPHEVKWIIPSIHVNRPMYSPESSLKSWEELSVLQNSRGRYDSIQKGILDALSPFHNEMGGQTVEHSMMTVIPKGKYRIAPCDEDPTADVFKRWLIQMVDAPYRGSVTTEHERVKLLGYYALQQQSLDFTRLFLAQTKMIDRQTIHSHHFSPMFNEKRFCPTLSQCIPSIQEMISHSTDGLSVYDTIRSLEPYLVYENDVLVKYYDDLVKPLHKRIDQYKRRKIPPPYTDTSSKKIVDTHYKLPPLTPSEWMYAIQTQDFGTLHTLIEQQTLDIQYVQPVDKFALAPQQPVTPPVAKIYTSLAQVKKDKGTIFWDTALDKTDYQEFSPYTTEGTLLQYLVDIKQMAVPMAKLYAKHYLSRKKVIVNGDYAKMNDSYFRRVDHEWVLDETCTGPYPCVSNEPDCEDDDCVDVVFRLNENLKHQITSEMDQLYLNEKSRVKWLTTSIDKANYVLQRKQMLMKMNEYKYNQRKLSLKASVSMTTHSAYQPLLFFILQKPHYERYKELQSFINMYTRPAGKGEKESWLYCKATNTPLVPRMYNRILEVYAIPDKYDALIKALLITNDIKREEDMYILTESGYPVGPTEYSQVFDDLVRSSELNETILFDIPRLEHEDTPVIIQLLSEIGNLIKYPMAKYFNFIVHDMDKKPSMYVNLSIAYMFKIASIVYSLNISDSITLVLSKQGKLASIMKQNGFKEDYTLTEKGIHSSIVFVSSNFVIQQLIYHKEKKLGNRTRHTIWNTFLPPLEIRPVKIEGSHPLKILFLLHEGIQSRPQLRQGNHLVNTCECSFMEKQLLDQLTHFKRPALKLYTRDKMFTPTHFEPEYEDAQFKIKRFKLNEKELIQEQREDFVERLTDTRKRLNRCLTIPEKFFSGNTPITFIKEFIYLIAKTLPERLKNSVRYEFEIPSYTNNMLSMTHKSVLNRINVQHYLNKIQESFPDSTGLGVHSVVSSVEVAEMLKRIELPTNSETSMYEFMYYVVRIFEIYMTHSDLSKTCVLIQMYIDLYMKERDNVFLSYEEIKRYTLKIKAKESNDRRVSLLGLSPSDKAIYQFREQNNLENTARLARLRTYNPDVFESLFSTFHGDQTEDLGTDGTHNDEEFE